mmetsp:Transcript_45408/g.88726  ORF Transcript_45408/g.88726 Transcript_45408/m.88726 type:complete len:216 (+) Transcript_45408:191-838(+)
MAARGEAPPAARRSPSSGDPHSRASSSGSILTPPSCRPLLLSTRTPSLPSLSLSRLPLPSDPSPGSVAPPARTSKNDPASRSTRPGPDFFRAGGGEFVSAPIPSRDRTSSRTAASGSSSSASPSSSAMSAKSSISSVASASVGTPSSSNSSSVGIGKSSSVPSPPSAGGRIATRIWSPSDLLPLPRAPTGSSHVGQSTSARTSPAAAPAASGPRP